MHAVDVLDNLIAAGAIKPLIAVLIHAAPGAERDQELQCGKELTEFVCTELVPWMRSRYPVSHAAWRTIIGGSSLGALEAAYIACRSPNMFGLLLAQSPSLQWAPPGATPDEINPWTSEQQPRRVYLSLGRDEPTITDKAQAFVRALRTAGRDVCLEEIEGQHDPINWRLTFPRGLLFLAKDWHDR